MFEFETITTIATTGAVQSFPRLRHTCFAVSRSTLSKVFASFAEFLSQFLSRRCSLGRSYVPSTSRRRDNQPIARIIGIIERPPSNRSRAIHKHDRSTDFPRYKFFPHSARWKFADKKFTGGRALGRRPARDSVQSGKSDSMIRRKSRPSLLPPPLPAIIEETTRAGRLFAKK